MTKKRKFNGDESKQFLEGRPVQAGDTEERGADSLPDPEEGMADAFNFEESDGETSAAPEDLARQVSDLLDAIKSDVNAHKDKVSGVIMVMTWNDGTTTHGWTGNFDPQQTAGKLFNLATDFAVFDAMRRLGSSATTPPKSQLN